MTESSVTFIWLSNVALGRTCELTVKQISDERNGSVWDWPIGKDWIESNRIVDCLSSNVQSGIRRRFAITLNLFFFCSTKNRLRNKLRTNRIRLIGLEVALNKLNSDRLRSMVSHSIDRKKSKLDSIGLEVTREERTNTTNRFGEKNIDQSDIDWLIRRKKSCKPTSDGVSKGGWNGKWMRDL